jgi:hypothetical protein
LEQVFKDHHQAFLELMLLVAVVVQEQMELHHQELQEVVVKQEQIKADLVALLVKVMLEHQQLEVIQTALLVVVVQVQQEMPTQVLMAVLVVLEQQAQLLVLQ